MESKALEKAKEQHAIQQWRRSTYMNNTSVPILPEERYFNSNGDLPHGY